MGFLVKNKVNRSFSDLSFVLFISVYFRCVADSSDAIFLSSDDTSELNDEDFLRFALRPGFLVIAEFLEV